MTKTLLTHSCYGSMVPMSVVMITPCTLDGCVRSNIDLKLALALRSQKFVQFFNSYFIF